MTEQEIIQFAANLPGVDILAAGEATDVPEIAWGDSFFYYDPDRDMPADKRFPFATIVTKDYPGFDEASNVDREGVFRLNVFRRPAEIRGADRLSAVTACRTRGGLRLHDHRRADSAPRLRDPGIRLDSESG